MSLIRRIGNLFSRSKVEREIDDELRSHLEMRIEDNIAAGMSPEEGRRDALLRFGNPVLMKEKTAGADVALGMESIGADIRFAFRQLRRSPGFAWTSIFILALGIGASTAIFSVVKPILLDPLPYPNAGRITMLWEMQRSGKPMRVTFATFHGMNKRNRSFDAMAVMKPWQPTMIGTDRPERLEGQRVSADFFRTLGVAPLLGRDFDDSDDRFRGPNVVILSDRLWRDRFASDKTIVGQQVRLDGNPYTVIGVMPRSFEDVLAPSSEVWAPLQYDPSLPADGREWGHHLRMVGRLREGVSREQAAAELKLILHGLAQINAKGYDSTGGAPDGMAVDELQSDLTQGVRPALLAVLSAVMLVLLIACVNVTNLLLARGTQRRAEFAMRAALGAMHGRLVRQLLTESLVLALLGAAFGMGVAIAGVHTLVALSPQGLPRVSAMSVDGLAFLFALGITTLIGVAVGLVPALRASRKDLQTGMRQSSLKTTGERQWMQKILVVSEVSLAAVLLVSAGLLLRSMQHLFAVDPGFDASHLLTMQVQASGHRFKNDAAELRFFNQTLEQVRRVPGVVSAGLAAELPLSGDSDVYGVEFEGGNNPGGEPALRYAVTPGYIETMRIPLRRGRLLNEHDEHDASVAVLISEAFANRKFPGRDPIGQRVRVGLDVGHADKPWATIVGVVGNVKQQSLAMGDRDAFYVSTAHWAWIDDAQYVVVRTRGNAAALAPAVRDAIWSVDKDVPIVRVATMDNLLAASEAQRRFVLMLFGAFALVGLVLAATGIYGVLAGSVSERTREIGVRSALGASRGSILALVIREGMTLTVLGALIGLIGAVAATHAIAALLFGITRLDPLTYFGVTVLLIGVSVLACFIPARRAASVNPVEALRAE
ncbi:MAG TPA: ABC transporter permease [Terracidiphilus sp.]|nr:ABC transporter permease [Terracidiphilus sp.]